MGDFTEVEKVAGGCLMSIFMMAAGTVIALIAAVFTLVNLGGAASTTGSLLGLGAVVTGGTAALAGLRGKEGLAGSAAAVAFALLIAQIIVTS